MISYILVYLSRTVENLSCGTEVSVQPLRLHLVFHLTSCLKRVDDPVIDFDIARANVDAVK